MAGVAIEIKIVMLQELRGSFRGKRWEWSIQCKEKQQTSKTGAESTKLPVSALSSFLVYPVYHEVSYVLQSNSSFTDTYLFYMV